MQHVDEPRPAVRHRREVELVVRARGGASPRRWRRRPRTAVRVPANLSGAMSTRMAPSSQWGRPACWAHEPDPIVAEVTVPVTPTEAFVGFTAQMGEWWDPMVSPEPATFTGIAIDPNGPVEMVHGDEQFTSGAGSWSGTRSAATSQEFWLGHPEDEATVLDVRFTEAEAGGTLVRLVHSGWQPGTETRPRRATPTGSDLLDALRRARVVSGGARPADARGRPRGVRRDHRDQLPPGRRPLLPALVARPRTPSPGAHGRLDRPHPRGPRAPTRAAAGWPRSTARWWAEPSRGCAS